MKEANAQMYEPVSELTGAARSIHKDIPPANIRIKQYRTKGFKHFNDAYAAVKEDDAKLIQQREGQEFKKGLLTANLGSIYDIPASMRDQEESSIAGSTQATSHVIQSTTDRAF